MTASQPTIGSMWRCSGSPTASRWRASDSAEQVVSAPTDDGGWLDLVREGMPPFWRLLADATGGRVWERQGLTAAIVPGSPKRSFFNSVLYEHPDAMVGSIDELSRAYREAGVEAWTVWVPEADIAVAQALEDAGHRLDARPRAMAMPLGDLREPDPDPGLEIREEPDF